MPKIISSLNSVTENFFAFWMHFRYQSEMHKLTVDCFSSFKETQFLTTHTHDLWNFWKLSQQQFSIYTRRNNCSLTFNPRQYYFLFLNYPMLFQMVQKKHHHITKPHFLRWQKYSPLVFVNLKPKISPVKPIKG